MPPLEPVKDKPDPSQDSEPTTAPVDAASTAPVPPSELGLPTYDAPFRSYGSSMAFSAYGALPYAAMAPAQLLDRRQSSIR